MKTVLPLSSKHAAFALSLTGKLMLAAFVLFCLHPGALAGIKPIIKTHSGHLAKSYTIMPAVISKAAKPITVPTISYSSPHTYLSGAAITPLTPTSTGVAAAAYSAGVATVGAGSGFGSPRGIAADPAGNVYMTDFSGNKVWKIPFGGGAATTIGSGFSGPDGVGLDAAGNIYISDYGTSSIKMIPVGSNVPVVVCAFSQPYGIAVSPAGDIYVADYNNGAIKKIAAGTSTATLVRGGFAGPIGVALDAAGNIYFGDASSTSINKIPVGGGATVFLGSGFSHPYGVAVDPAGNIIVGDAFNGAVKEIMAVGGATVTLNSTLSLPTGVAVDGAGNIFISDYNAGAVKEISPIGGFYTGTLPVGLTIDQSTGTISGTPTATTPTANYTVTAYNASGNAAATVNIAITTLSISYSSPNSYTVGVAIPALSPTSTSVGAAGYTGSVPATYGTGFSNPSDIAVDRAGNLFIADNLNDKIKMIPAGGGAPVNIGSGFTKPIGVAVDTSGNIFVTLSGSSLVYERLKSTSNVVTFGSGFTEPMGLATDIAGNVYVADHTDNKIYKIPANNTTPVAIGTGFLSPYDVAVDAAGNVYVADYGHNAIKKIAAAGGATTTLASGFNGPSSVTVDAFGNVFVGDFNNNAVKKVTSAGAVSTIGSGFVTPYGVAADAAGNVFVADDGNSRIAKIAPSGGYYISPALPAGLAMSNSTGSITGTPTAVAAANTYTVTAYNTTLSTTAAFSLKVDALSISYATPQTYIAGTAIAPLTPVVHNTVAAPAFGTATIVSAVFNGPLGVAVDAAGNTYVADYGNNAVRKIPANGGAVVTIGSGFSHPSGVAVDAAGNVYVADSGNNAVKMIPVGGGSVVTLGSGFSNPVDVKVDAAGNVYVADRGHQAVKKIPAGSSNTIILSQAFNGPLSIALDPAGNVFEVDINATSIYEIPVGGGGNRAIGGALNGIQGITIDASGNLYVTEFPNNDIVKIAAGTQAVSQVVSGLNHPGGVNIDANGNLFIADQGSNSIKKAKPIGGYFINPSLPPGLTINASTGIISGTSTQAVAAADYLVTAYNGLGSGSATVNIKINAPALPTVTYSTPQQYVVNTAITPLAPGGAGVAAPAYSANPTSYSSGFSKPEAIAVDAAGNVYVNDLGHFTIKKIPAGNGAPVSIGSGFVNPAGVAVDAAGNVYVADFSNQAVKKIPVGGGAPVAVGTGFAGPTGVTLDAAGNIFVADFNASAVKEILAGGNTTVTIGSGFDHPYSVAVDGAGNVYVSDTFHAMIKKIPVGGGVPVNVGSSQSPYGMTIDGAGNLFVAERDANDIREFPADGSPSFTVGSGFLNPYDVAVDVTGNLYVADYGNDGVKVITPTGGYHLNTFLPAGLNFNSATGIISGTPTALTPAVNYTITGFNIGGGASATLNISVNQFAAPAISYSSPNTYFVNNAIAALSPANSGGPVSAPGYFNSSTTLGSGFSAPTDATVDAAGNVYVADRNNNAVKKIPVGGGAPVSIGSGFSSPAGVAVDIAGNVFVTDGGTGILKEIPVGGGAVIDVATGFNNPFGVAIDAAGNLYVADYGNNAVKEIPAGSSIPVVIGSGFNGPIGVAVDAAGNVYVADYNNNLVKQIPVGGGAPVTIGSGFSHPADVAVDFAGNVFVADYTNNAVKEIPFGGGATFSIGPGFSGPFGVAVDGAGNVYEADYLTSSIRKITPSGGYYVNNLPAGLTINASTGIISGTPTAANPATNYTVTAYNATGGSAAVVNITVSVPPSITYSSPHTYTAGTAITALTPGNTGGAVPATAYSTVSTLAGSGTAGSVNGTGAAASFTGLMNMTADGSGNVYAADYTANIIRKISPAGVATTLAGSGTAGNANGTGIAASFKIPFGVVADASGNVYIGDAGNNLIRKITPAGVVTTFAGSGTAGSTNATGIAASFSNPHGLAIDAAGNIYVADYGNNLIRKITPAGVVTTFAGSGTAGNTNGTGTAASFSGPISLCADAAGNIYVAEYANRKIRKITPATVVTTFAGSGVSGSADGTGAAATFKSPYAMTVDKNGNIYVADESNNEVRMITPAAVVTTLAGNGTAGSTNGIGTAAKLNDPRGVAVDAYGNLYVSDYAGHQVRKIVLTGYTINPALPAGMAFNGATGVISGTPTTGSPATDYAVIAYNMAGSSAATVNVTVNPIGGVTPPAISYTTPHTYTAGTAITALTPGNSGGAVPATIYSTVSTLAGSGTAGSANGTGATASFSGLMNMDTDGSGNVYVADYTADVIRKINSAGVATTLAGSGTAGNANGTGTAASFKTPFGVATDAAGNVYIGDAGNNLIRKITPAGVVTTLAGSGTAGSTNATGIAASFSNPHGLTTDAAGNIYVADYGNNLIRKITPAGVVTTLAGSGVAGNVNGTGTAASFNGPISLCADAAGNIYVAEYVDRKIRKVTPAGVVTTFAGSGVSGNSDGTGAAATFKNPYGMAIDKNGNIYVADESNNEVRMITPAAVVTTLADTGTAGSTNGTGTAAALNDPRGVAVDTYGNLYVSDYAGHQVRKIVLTGYTISPALPASLIFNSVNGVISGTPTIANPATDYTVTAYNAAGSGTATVNITVNPMGGMTPPVISYSSPQTYTAGTAITALSPGNTGGAVPATVYSAVTSLAGSGTAGVANGTGASASFTGLMNMDTDGSGNVYAADYTANVIRKVSPAGVATTFAGSGTAGNTNATGTAASFKTPFGVAVDASGNVYIGDAGNNLIRKITSAGVVTTLAGSGMAGNTNATGAAASFSGPHGLAADASGNIYVADYGNNLIRKITPAGVVTTLAGSGVAGSVNGTGTAASFSGPISLCADAAGNIYVAEYANRKIRKITPGGVVTTFAGSGASGSADGTGAAATFKSPYGMTIDKYGNIYVADESNNEVRRITPGAVVTTLAGNGTAGSTNGTGTAAKLNDPRGVAADAGGNLYVSDYAGHQVRKIVLTGYTISPALPMGLTFNSATGVITGTPTTASPATDYTVTAYNATGSGTATVNITVDAMGGMAIVKSNVLLADPAQQDAPAIKQGISPNGDGINDVLIIDNIEKYPDNKLTIMDRSGSTVYQVSGYDNTNKVFDGRSSKSQVMQRAGTYFYQLEYKDKGAVKYKTGYLLIKF